MNPPLTILITTLNRRDILEKTLFYIYETSDASERDLWIWDNGSEDDTAAFLGTLQGWPGVRCFRSPSGVGIVPAKTRMVRNIRTPYVFTMDDDMWMVQKGWASAVVRILENVPSIHQLTFGQFGDRFNNLGISHEELGPRPFFRVPPVIPFPGGRSRRDPAGPEGTETLLIGEDEVIVPTSGPHLPYPNTGGCAGWRVADILPLLDRPIRHPVADLREVWGEPLAERGGTRESTIVGYGIFHPSPGPAWHLGRGETYWEERCRMAPAIYNRSGEEQRSWLENARRLLGWGRALENSVFP